MIRHIILYTGLTELAMCMILLAVVHIVCEVSKVGSPEPIVFKVSGSLAIARNSFPSILGLVSLDGKIGGFWTPIVKRSILGSGIFLAQNKTFYVNQDGLRDRKISRPTKLEFKERLKRFREIALLELPDPFTGVIEFHCSESLLKVIKFYPK